MNNEYNAELQCYCDCMTVSVTVTTWLKVECLDHRKIRLSPLPVSILPCLNLFGVCTISLSLSLSPLVGGDHRGVQGAINWTQELQTTQSCLAPPLTESDKQSNSELINIHTITLLIEGTVK